MGSAAAMQVSVLDWFSAGQIYSNITFQAFKLFTSGGSSSASSASSAGNSQSQLLSLAMGEAVKRTLVLGTTWGSSTKAYTVAALVFNNSGGPSSGGKQDVVNSASKTMLKLMLQVSY